MKSTIHWVSAQHAIDAEVRIYENLFTKENLARDGRGQGRSLDYLNPNSLEVIPHAKLEPSLANAAAGSPVSVRAPGIFLCRSGFQAGRPVFNRTVALKDAWAKVEKKQGGK